jgi:hypothetical protein
MSESHFQATLVRSFPIDQRHSLILPPGASHAFPVLNFVPHLLKLCLVPRTLAEHETFAANYSGTTDREFIRTTIGLLVRAGLMQEVTEGPATVKVDHIATIQVICGADDTRHDLERCLSSYLSVATPERRDVRVVVINAAASAQSSHRATSLLDMISRSYGQRLEHWGHPQAIRVARRLRALGYTAAARSLTTISTNAEARAASRLLGLLLSAGSRVLTVNANTVCQTWTPPNRVPFLAVRGHSDPRQYTFSDASAVLPADQVEASDCSANIEMFAAHARVLGRSLSTLIRQWQFQVDARHSCGHLEAALADMSTSHRVRIGSTGTIGEYSPRGLYECLLSGGSGLRTLYDHDSFARAVSCRNVSRVTSQVTLTHDPICDTGCMSLDNSEVLPPFVGCDGTENVFAATLALCDPYALFAHLPYAVSREPRLVADSPDEYLSIGSINISDLLMIILSNFTAPAALSDISLRLARIGEHLSSIADQRPKDFIHWLRCSAVKLKATELATLDGLVNSTDIPSHCKAAAHNFRTLLLELLEDDTFCIPVEYRSVPTLERSAAALRALIRQQSILLQEWPPLWKHANENKWRSPVALQ